MLLPDFSQGISDISKNISPLSRRKALGGLGLTGLGILASTGVARAFGFSGKGVPATGPRVTVATGSTSGFPQIFTKSKTMLANAGAMTGLASEWVAAQGSLVAEYDRYLSSLRLQRITPHQVIAAHAKEKGGVWNTLPPKSWWTRMGYTLRVIDRIALQLNTPVEEIVSAYRSPAYNHQCYGAKSGSWHQANVAVDVKFPISAPTVAAVSRSLRDRGLFKGGIGSYSGFTHIDTRGENMNWQG